jgi:CHAD domain-containing protein
VRPRHAPADRAPDRDGHGVGAGRAEPAAGGVAGLLARLGANVEAAAARCRNGDDEAIHDLRVAARRLETALQLWRDALVTHAVRRTRRMLRRWRRRLSVARDLEILVDALADPGLATTPGDAVHLATVRARLTRRRDRARRRAAASFTPARAERLRRRLLATQPESGPGVPADRELLAAVERHARCERVARERLAGAWTTLEDGPLHAARIAIKKRRYAEEALAAVTGLPLSAGAASARALQRALGAVHDSAELRDCLRSHANRALARNRPEQATALTDAAGRTERSRLEAIDRFRSLRGPVPGPAPAG